MAIIAPFLVILSMWIVKMDSKTLRKIGESLCTSTTDGFCGQITIQLTIHRGPDSRLPFSSKFVSLWQLRIRM